MNVKRLITFLFSFVLFFSCNEGGKKHWEKDILGEWSYVKTVDLRKSSIVNLFPLFNVRGNAYEGYIFNADKTCENKLGYEKRDTNRITLYLGNITRYSIEGDSLKIYNLSDSTWDRKKIAFLSKNTLLLQSQDSVYEKFERMFYKPDTMLRYDEIAVASSGCYGTCPISGTLIKENGEVFYFGREYNTRNGFFTSKISKADYQTFLDRFKIVPLEILSENNSSMATHDEMVSVTFIQKGRIIKTISDYGRAVPAELIWAYTPVRYLYQKLLLDTVSNPNLLPYLQLKFESKREGKYLSPSESLLLISALRRANIVDTPFLATNKLLYYTLQNQEEFVKTNGRYYTIHGKTYDLGYNFLLENHLMR